jgi:phosphoglucosamine mutase
VATTGDGIIASLQVLMALQAAQGDLAALRRGITMYPQTMINVATCGKVDLDDYPEISAAVASVEERLAGEGRVLLRPSGTEPKIRVMVEGSDADEVKQLCAELAAEVKRLLA